MSDKVSPTTALTIIEALIPKSMKAMVAQITTKQLTKYKSLIEETSGAIANLKSSFFNRLKNWGEISRLESRLSTLKDELKFWMTHALQRLNLSLQIAF